MRLTTFFAFDLLARRPEGISLGVFVLNLPLSGGPADRKERVLRSFLENRGKFLRFLMLLLADERFEPTAVVNSSTPQTAPTTGKCLRRGRPRNAAPRARSLATRLDHSTRCSN